MSNVLGTVVDVRTICRAARAMGVPVLVDGSQAAVHMAVDVSDIGCDFYVVTGHKLYGPTGSGALYARRERLAEMRPFLGGGDMIREVRQDAITYADPPLRMEAGTPGIVQTIGLGVALDYMTGLGMDSIAAHERSLARLCHRPVSGAELAEHPGQGARTRGRSSRSRWRGRRTRTTSRPWSTARAWRSAPGITAPSR